MAVLFILGLAAFLVGFVIVLSDIDPAFGVPRAYYSVPPILNILLSVPPVLAGLGLLSLVFAILAWVKCYWTARARVFYTLLAAWFAICLWSLFYWRLLFPG